MHSPDLDRALSVAILVPTLARPQNVAPLVESIQAFTPQPYRILFICDPGDVPAQDEIAKAGCQMISPGGGYAHKIRAGIHATDEALIVTAADDLRFTPDWLEAASSRLSDTIQVVGLNDGIRRRKRPEHATHFLMTRAAAQLPCLDGSPGPFFDYGHWRCDDELIATATKRGMYAYAPESLVRHVNHPMQGGPDDSTYRLGRAHAATDNYTFDGRRPLWEQ